MGLDVTGDQIERLIAQLQATNETALARLNQHLQSMLPVYMEESGTGSAIAESASGSVVLNATRDTYFKITGIYVSIPFGSTVGQLQLGKLFLPIQNTTTLLTPVQVILKSTDKRALTFTTGADNGGAGYVWLWGEAIPSNGIL